MKAMAIGLAFVFAAGAAVAQTAPANDTCLNTRDIDHTHAVDATTVLFYMRDHTVWKNTLTSPCPGLKFHGFGFVAHDTDRVCSNGQAIRVLVTDQVCALGAFTPATPGAAAGQAAP
jgi:hypothetical protein